MDPLRFEIRPLARDPGAWAASLVNLAELLISALDAAAPRSVVEVGAYAGDLTDLLLDWAEESGARVSAVDPAPQPELVELAERRAGLELVRAASVDALRRLPVVDAVILDGDHNYWTVGEELRIIAERAAADGARLPLVLLHDVCWPHARRDDYFDPEAIPHEYRQPTVEGGHLYPGVSGINEAGGLAYKWPAAREGGPRNGVLTAVEDFLAERDDDLRLAVVPAFFGLGVLWRLDAPYAGALAELLDAWDRNPLLERLERNRVVHLASSQVQLARASAAEARLARQEQVLRRLLVSSAFSVAERLSRLRHRAGIGTEHAVVSKTELRRALSE
jgi:hypothetical protein